MIRCHDNGLVYYQFEIFQSFSELVHGVFTRQGGVSPAPCRGLNLAFVPEDDEANVRTNLELVRKTLGFEALAFAGQVHDHQVLVVRAGDGYRPRRPAEVRRGYDALVTPDPGLGLLVKLADCQGLLLFDPETKMVAVVHCGWRGSAAGVIGRTVGQLADDFGVRPGGLLAGIGPSLGPCCAEFVNYRDELPVEFRPYRVSDHHFDFWAISRDQLLAAGLKPENIETAGICTVCGSDEFYSYRRDKKVTGRFGLIAGRRKEK